MFLFVFKILLKVTVTTTLDLEPNIKHLQLFIQTANVCGATIFQNFMSKLQ